MINLQTKYKIFQISWIIFLLGVICDLNLIRKMPLLSFSLNVQFSSIGAVILVISYLVTTNVKDWLSIIKDKFDRDTFLILSILMVIAYISSSLSEMVNFAIGTTMFRLTLFFLTFICSVGFVNKFNESKNFIIKSFVYMNLLVVLSSIADYYLPEFNRLLISHFGHMENHHSVLKLGGITYFRPSGFITDTNLTAYSIIFSLIIILVNFKFFNKKFIWAFVILSGYCFGMLGSRSALIVFIITFILFYILKYADRKLVIIMGLTFLLIQIVTPQTQARIIQVFDKKYQEEEMMIGRPVIWKADIKAFKTSPIIGIGTGVFFKKSNMFITEVLKEEGINPKDVGYTNEKQEEGLNPHSIFLAMLAEYGVIGLLAFNILLFHLFRFYLKEKLYLSVFFFAGLLFVSALSNYAPYYKYYFVMCIIFYLTAKQNMMVIKNEK